MSEEGVVGQEEEVSGEAQPEVEGDEKSGEEKDIKEEDEGDDDKNCSLPLRSSPGIYHMTPKVSRSYKLAFQVSMPTTLHFRTIPPHYTSMLAIKVKESRKPPSRNSFSW